MKEDQEDGTKVAYLLEDLLKAVESKRKTVGVRDQDLVKNKRAKLEKARKDKKEK